MRFTDWARGFFFGWWVVFAAFAGIFFGLSTFIGVTFGLFLKPLAAEFGWSRTEISFGLTLCAYTIAVLAVGFGQLIDRFGARRVILPAVFLFGGTVCAMSLLTSSIGWFYGMYLLIALTGLGTLPTGYTRVILNWFDRRRGLALGIALSGIGISGMVLPPVLQHLIATHGWRSTYLVMGLAVLLVSLPLIYSLLREHPRSMGLRADGARHETSPAPEPAAAVPEGLTMRESLLDRSFWIVIVAFALLGLGGTGVIAHMMALFTDRGLSPALATSAISLFSLFVIVGRVSCGFLVDRFFAPYVGVAFLAGPALGVALLALDHSTAGVFAAAVLLGLGLGAEFDLLSYFISRYLGLLAYGKIYGAMYGGFQVGAGIGPLVMGLSFDRSGSYFAGLWILFACICVAVLLVSRLGPYRYASAGTD